MKIRHICFSLCIALVLFSSLVLKFQLPSQAHADATNATNATNAATTFANPLGDGEDPFVTRWNGNYYYVRSYLINNVWNIIIQKSPTLEGVGTAPGTIVWTPGSNEPGGDVWSPVLYALNGSWYIYFCSDNTPGNFSNHRIQVLQGPAANSDPTQGSWTYKAQIDTGAPSGQENIDPDIIVAPSGSPYPYYLLYEQKPNTEDIYIVGMSDPLTGVPSTAMQLAAPTYSWEGSIDEGPRYLQHDGKYFIVYSANAYSTCDYALGLLTNTDGNFLNPSSWSKSANPVFAKSGNVCGPGRASFTTSPDGTQDWIFYHTKKSTDSNSGLRELSAQPFGWNSDGTPNFGTPAQKGTATTVPSGSPSSSLEADDTDFRTNYTGTWHTASPSAYFQGTAHWSSTAGDAITFTFVGTSITWIGGRNSDHGKADVYIDNSATPDATIDTYAPNWQTDVSLYTKSDLSYALHTIKIVVDSDSDRNPASTFNTTDVDAFLYGNPA